MRFLLDENFPLALARRLRAEGHEVEHVVETGPRGLPDSVFRRRIETENVVFLTQDHDFLDARHHEGSVPVISSVPQNLPIAVRIDAWTRALAQLPTRFDRDAAYEILEGGRLLPWRIARGP